MHIVVQLCNVPVETQDELEMLVSKVVLHVPEYSHLLIGLQGTARSKPTRRTSAVTLLSRHTPDPSPQSRARRQSLVPADTKKQLFFVKSVVEPDDVAGRDSVIIDTQLLMSGIGNRPASELMEPPNDVDIAAGRLPNMTMDVSFYGA